MCFQVTNRQKQKPLLERIGGLNLLQRVLSPSSCKRRQKEQHLSPVYQTHPPLRPSLSHLTKQRRLEAMALKQILFEANNVVSRKILDAEVLLSFTQFWKVGWEDNAQCGIFQEKKIKKRKKKKLGNPSS